MKKKTAWIGVLLILLIGVGAAVRASCSDVRTNAVTFYVAPDGSDGAAGTAKAPFATLLRARDAVRALKQSQTNDFDVIIRGGRYPFSKTLVFGLEDSAVECQTITYKAAAGEQPVLSGGTVLSGWQRTELPGNIWVADFPSTGKNILTLYCGETRLPRARGKGFTPSKKYDFKNVSGPVTDTIEFPPGALKNYADLKHAEMVVRTSAAWAMNILPLVSVDEVSGIAKTAPCNYSLGRMWGTPETPDDMWVENVLAELDAPGEWVAHPDEAKIYYWPLNDQQPVDVIFPAVTEIIRVEGRTDYGGPVDTPVKGLHFEGLTFMHADRMLTPDQIGGRGLQHGWDYFDSPNAMLRFRGAENCSIKNCRFTAGGDNGIRLDLHAQKITIENSLFDHLGGAAAVFAGYGLGTKDANKNNAFINNHVYRVCELKKDRPALFIWQSGGNRIANNLIHDVPYAAISVSCRAAIVSYGEGRLSRRDNEISGVFTNVADYAGWKSRERFWHGRDNTVESNEIFAAVQSIADGNPIYISGTAGGNVVRYNYVHDCWSYNVNAAIRCDDDQHETRIEKNLITDIAGSASAIVIKGKNDVLNNICANIYRNDEKYHVGMLAVRSYKPDGCRIEHNVFYCPEPDRILSVVAGITRPYGAEGNQQIELKNSQVRNNLYWSPVNPVWAADYLTAAQTNGSEQGSRIVDPLLAADLGFSPGSPALEMGIVPVTSEGKGVRQSVWLNRLAALSRSAADEARGRVKEEGAKVKK